MGTRFRLFVQSPFAEAGAEPEIVTVSLPVEAWPPAHPTIACLS